MTRKIKSFFLISLLALYLGLFSTLEFPIINAKIIDILQFFNGDIQKNTDLLTFNINYPNPYLKRPFKFADIDIIIKKIVNLKPKIFILMISPRELDEDPKEKSKILDLFLKYDNLFLFSPYTNGPLGGFKADPIFSDYPRHFRLPAPKDALFGAKDLKIRRAILSYTNKGEEPFLGQLRDLGLSNNHATDYSSYFELWDSKQIFIKTRKLGTFGFYNLFDSTQADLKNTEGKTFFIGTFDEFSSHISPSVFDFEESLSKDNFKKYFFPIQETAANIVYNYSTKDYVKLTKTHDLFIIFVFLLLLFNLKIDIKKQLYLFILIIPMQILITIFIYISFSYYVDLSKSMVATFYLYYFLLPLIIFYIVKKNELTKLEIIHTARLHSLVSVSEKVAHDIRSPLSAVNLLISQLKIDDLNTSKIIHDSLLKIDSITQSILTKSKNDLKHNQQTVEEINIKPLIEKIVSEKIVINNLIKYDLNLADELICFANILELEIVISNTIDNSIYALQKMHDPKISINSYSENNLLHIQIIDNGTGINNALINIIGKYRLIKKITDSKSNGIGVLHAKKTIENFGGKFEIKNNINKSGVSVHITLNKI